MKRVKMQKRSRGTRALVLALAAVATMTIAVRSSAATLYVSQTSTNPSPPYATLDTAAHTIQDAVDAASDGDTVLVSPDKYGLTNQVTITKGITLRSMTGIALGGTTGIALGGTTGASQTTLSGLGNNWCLW